MYEIVHMCVEQLKMKRKKSNFELNLIPDDGREFRKAFKQHRKNMNISQNKIFLRLVQIELKLCEE